MRKLVQVSSALLLCGASVLMPAQALWQAGAWKVFEGTALGVASNAFYDFVKQQWDGDKVAQWQQDISDLTAQLTQLETDAPSANPAQQEIARLKQTLADTQTLLKTMQARLDKVEPRVDNLESELAQIKTHIEAFTSQHPKEAQTAGVKMPEPALQFDINYVYRAAGQGELQPLTEGAVLQSGDHYKLVFTPKQKAFVYVFQRDSANKLFQLFPMQQMGGVVVNNHNPVQAGKTYTIPAEDKSFYLDQQTGTESLYFIAAPEQDKKLEAGYKALKRTEQSEDEAKTLVAAANFDQALHGKTRGAAGIIDDPQAKAKHSVQGDDGQSFAVLVDEFFGQCETAQGCLHVRTFEHR